MEVAFLRRCTVSSELRHQSIRAGEATDVVKTKSVNYVLHVVHDCKGGFCKLVERNQGQFSLEHSLHDVFFFNKFRLSKLPDKL